jgi:hypothetical protein
VFLCAPTLFFLVFLFRLLLRFDFFLGPVKRRVAPREKLVDVMHDVLRDMDFLLQCVFAVLVVHTTLVHTEPLRPVSRGMQQRRFLRHKPLILNEPLNDFVTRQVVVIWTRTNVIHATMLHFFVVHVVHKTDLGIGRQHGTPDQVSVRLPVGGATCLDQLVVDLERTNQFVEERLVDVAFRFQGMDFSLEILCDQLHPFFGTSVVGVNEHLGTLLGQFLFVDVFQDGDDAWSKKLGIQIQHFVELLEARVQVFHTHPQDVEVGKAT